MSEAGYTLIYEPNSAVKTSISDFKSLLEKSRDDIKIDTMKRILITMLNGDPLSDLLMHIIRFVMPSKNKELKKLLYFYWEICPKCDSNGKMKQEMILVCNAIQRDLQHPNEYIRGNTLRFLSKLKETDLLETLVPNVRQCLEHRHAYVRKNAVFALYSIYKVSDHLAPDADELIYRFLCEETDSVCKRNAFVCLIDLNRDAALQYIQDNISIIDTLDSLLQLAFIEFIRKDALNAPSLKDSYTQVIIDIVENSSSNVVLYEAATTLTFLSSNLTNLMLAGKTFVEIAAKEADNNVKVISLDRISELHKLYPNSLQDLSLDVLSVLTTQDLDVRKKVINVTLKLITSRNVEEVVKLLKKELQKTATSNDEKATEYRQLLINAIHKLAVDFSEIAPNVVDLLFESMGDLTNAAAYEVIAFVKEIVEKVPDLRKSILSKLINAMPAIKSGKVNRGALWIIGEYSLEEKSIQEAWKCIRDCIGEVPILASEKRGNKHAEEDEKMDVSNGSSHKTKGPVILPDGTYATENAFTAQKDIEELSDIRPSIRKLILDGDFYLGAVLSSTLLKLVLRLQKITSQDKILNALKAEAVLIMVSILRVGQSSYVSKKIDEDSAERIFSYIKYLSDDSTTEIVQMGFLEDTKNAFKAQVEAQEKASSQVKSEDLQKNASSVDDLIVFRQFSNSDASKSKLADEFNLSKGDESSTEDLTSRLNRIVQLTGFSDPIYAEAYVKIHQYDVVLDVLLVNQTTTTLRNLSVEFAALGDLKIVDKPAAANVGPHGFYRVQTTVKVTSADTGVIFGNIVYDGQHSDESTIVILNDVHVDIMDYIKPAICSENVFRKMWNEFEWENKITIKSQSTSLKEYLDELMAGTNMSCLTPGAVIGEECSFLSANLYSRSTFGEDALANLCIEKQQDGPIIGHVRIRSKGQGLALSLGDRVASISKKTKTVQVSRI